MAVTANRPAPYAPSSAVLDIITRFRNRGLPLPVNSEVLGRAGVSPSLIPRTLYALQILDLIDDTGAPTAIFDNLRLAPETEYQTRMADWLKGAYADVFAFVDPAKDDHTRIRDAFRSYEPVGQQSRMVTLFQGLCVAAGLRIAKETVAGNVSPAARPRPAAPSTPSIRRSAKPPSKKPLGDGGRLGLPPALEGLLASLPDADSGWTKEVRDRFMTTFGAVLDFCIPVVKQVPTKENGGP